MGAQKRLVKGYYFSLKAHMRPKDGNQNKFRILNSNDIQLILDQIRSTPLLERFRDNFILTLKGDSVRGDGVNLPEYNGYTSALFMKKRSTDLPKTAREEADGIIVNSIEIGDDAFFMETTYVLIHIRTATVLFLVNGNVSTSSSPFTRYIKNFLPEDEIQYIEAIPILNTNSLKRLNDMETVKGIELSFRGSLSEIEDKNKTMSMGEMFSQVLEDKNNQYTSSFKVVMSASRNKSINKKIARLIHNNIMENAENKKRASIFKVWGKGESGIETIDFLNDEFLFTFTSDVSTRNLDPSEIFTKMHSHFEASLGHIRESIGDFETYDVS